MPNARCPAVDRDTGRAVPDDGGLVSSQWGIVVHELADKYLHFGETREQARMWPEVYNLQGVIGLGAEMQVMNAQNFAMFACGELNLLICGRREGEEMSADECGSL